VTKEKMHPIIGITGNMRHGKDTLGLYYINNCKYIKMSFAGPLKYACQEIFDLSNDQIDGDKKDNIDDYWGVTPRAILQYVGTELFRDQMEKLLPDIGKDVWIKTMDKKIKKILKGGAKGVVITDVRFENEAKLIKSLGGIVIKVVRPASNTIHSHSSEKLLFDVDYTVINDGSIQHLHNKLCHQLGY
jgi:hypothetical protein